MIGYCFHQVMKLYPSRGYNGTSQAQATIGGAISESHGDGSDTGSQLASIYSVTKAASSESHVKDFERFSTRYRKGFFAVVITY